MKPGATPTSITPAGRPDDVIVVSDPQGQVKAFTRREWDYAGAEVQRQYNRLTEISAAAPGAGTQRGSGDTSLQPAQTPMTVQAAVSSDAPLDSLAALALHNRGEVAEPAAVRSDSMNIAHGINALLSGNPDGAWAEPYLNDTARLAWARQEAQAGRASDPRQAPVEYVEKWKDAFYGRDSDVPLVREINQQMIDYGAERTPPGQPFNWQATYGVDGSKGLIHPQVTGLDCGPNAFATILRSRGYNTDPWDTFDFAIQNKYHDSRRLGYHSYTNAGFTGPDQMVNMLRKEAGLDASSVDIAPNGAGWNHIDRELGEGRPVIVSSIDHYWAVSAKDPTTGRYYVGSTALKGSPEWMTPEQFRYTNGAANRAIFARGDVDPNSRAVTSMGLKPPATVQANTRGYLSGQARQTVPGAGAAAGAAVETPSAPQRAQAEPPAIYAGEYERKAYNAAVAAGHPDPYEFVEQIRQESGYAPDVISGKRASSAGAQGIAQIIPSTAKQWQVNPLDPDAALAAAAKNMTAYHKKYGDSAQALAAYNMGEGNLAKYGPRGLAETKQYIDIIGRTTADAKQRAGVGTQRGAIVDAGMDPGSEQQLDSLATEAEREDPWSTNPADQRARHQGMRTYFEMEAPQREQVFDAALERALDEEGITGAAEREHWKRNMKLVALGDRSFPGENPGLNPFMMAGETKGTRLYAAPSRDKSAASNELNSSAMGYYQFIINDPDDKNKDPYGHRRFIPEQGKFFDPVTQQRMFIRAIKGSRKHHGDPASVVNEKRNSRDHTWGP